MWSNPQKTADLVTFTEEILSGKLHFFEENFIYIINKYTFEKARSIQDVTISRTNQKRFFYCSVSSFCLNK